MADLYSLLLDLCESRLIPSETSLKTWKLDSLNELAYLYFLALRILLSDDATKQFAKHYCTRVVRSDFRKWRTDGNDFYVLLYAVSNESRNRHSSVSPGVIRDWLDHVGHADFDARTHRLFNRLDGMFRINNSTLKTSRRLIMHWDDTDDRERQDLLDKLIQQIKKLAPRSELLDQLKQLSKQYNNAVPESASAGATGSASVATSVSGLGSGFDGAHGDRGIYNQKKKPVVVQR